MNLTDMEDFYVFIRLWCPEAETETPTEPLFVQRLDTHSPAGVQWTVTREFDEAAIFKSERLAKRLVRSVDRLRHRIQSGWLYEIVTVTEKVIEHNLPPPSVVLESGKEEVA